MREQKLISKCYDYNSNVMTCTLEPFKEEIAAGWEVVSYQTVRHVSAGAVSQAGICITALLERILINVKS